MTPPLVLSLFPGLDGFGMGFEQEGFCVVAGPDLQWGRRIEDFHPPAGCFDGVIGGPPCQRFIPLANLVRHVHGEDALAPNLIPEFERCVTEAQPNWFVMENSTFAPVPVVPGYVVRSVALDNRWIGDGIGQVQHRRRLFAFGTHTGKELILDVALFEHPEWERAVMARSPYHGDATKLASVERNWPKFEAERGAAGACTCGQLAALRERERPQFEPFTGYETTAGVRA